MKQWLTERVCRLVSRRAAQLPPARREWGEAVVAELAAVPAGERRLRWALGSLWFVVTRGGPAADPAVRWWTRPICAVAGIVTVGPWLIFSVQGLAERDAPDGTFRSYAVMLAGQAVLVAAFLANGRNASGRLARSALLAALAADAAASAFASLDNVGEPLLAAAAVLLFAGPSLLAALPLLATPGRAGRRRPTAER